MLILALLFMFPPGLRASASNSGLHADIAALLKQEGLTRAVWAMLDPERGITVDAAGVKDARTGQSLGADDRVHVGSVVKPLIATGVLRLVTEGKLSLDTQSAAVAALGLEVPSQYFHLYLPEVWSEKLRNFPLN